MSLPRRALFLPILALTGCVSAVAAPPPPPAPPPPAVKVDPCAAIGWPDRGPSRLHLDGSAAARLSARCAFTSVGAWLHVVATSPDLSDLRPVGYFGLEIELNVPDAAAAFATLPPVGVNGQLTLTCAPGQHIPAALFLEKPLAWGAAMGTCLPFTIHSQSTSGDTWRRIDLRPGISWEDFDASVTFARTHRTRFVLTPSSIAWAEPLRDLPFSGAEVLVNCQEDKTSVDVAALAKLEELRELSLIGPCRLEHTSEGASSPRFARLRKLSWYASATAIDVRGIGVFAAITEATIQAKNIVGAAEIAKLTALETLWLEGTMDHEPAAKRLQRLTKLEVPGPAPKFTADLPALAELKMGECAPVESRTLTRLDCALNGPVSFLRTPNLTTLTLTLGNEVELSPLAQVKRLGSLRLSSPSPRRVSLDALTGAGELETLTLPMGCFSRLEDLYRLPKLKEVGAPRIPPAPPGMEHLHLEKSGEDTCPATAVAR